MITRFGESRTHHQRDHAFIAPDGHVATPHPSWSGADPVVLIAPQMGARFTQLLIRTEGAGAVGRSPLAGIERFLFVLDGGTEIDVNGMTHALGAYGYAYLPADTPHTVRPEAQSVLTLIERRYLPLTDVAPPAPLFGNERELTGDPFLGDPTLTVRKLLPDTDPFDLAINTMSFEPGTPLPFVETHVMEHGMLMLEGGGVYRLGDRWYPITAGDTLWMGPFCPQWFGALGRAPSKYLLYKESRRDPVQHAEGS
jgi:(S)-ureidoglycine aminohydrolase